MSPSVRVVAAVALRGGRVFLARRPPGGRHAGLWEFPGGKVEPGEDDATALARELMEELAVDARVGDLVGIGADANVELWCYRVEFLGEPAPAQGQEISWFDLGDLPHLPTPEADRPVMEALTLAGIGI